MNLTAFGALVRRDVRLFFLDKRAMTMSFVAPIVIASFFGYLFGGVTKDRQPAKVDVAIVDQDGSAVSRRVVESLGREKMLDVKIRSADEARARVQSGKTTVAAVLPAGFGAGAVRGLFGGKDRPAVEIWYDPSHSTELAMIRGMLAQHVMEAVGAEASGGRPLSLPFRVSDEAVTSRKGVEYNGMAHSFAGMSVQFVLFMGIDAGLIVLAQRRSGMWKRLQAAPISRFLVIGSRAASATLIAMIILAVVFGFARAVFAVRIEGSFLGFVGVCASFSLTTAMFGLLVAVLGKTPEGTRGISILVTLILVMLGGSWVPTFLFPQWLQKATVAIPTRWAVDGMDAMIWRGLGLEAALAPIAALLGFAALFGAVAVWRFRWQKS
jgi:ABC-2 type transport system permease protein